MICDCGERAMCVESRASPGVVQRRRYRCGRCGISETTYEVPASAWKRVAELQEKLRKVERALKGPR